MLDKYYYLVKNKEVIPLSKYTDFLNAHPNIDYKTFVKVCAWNSKAVADFVPKELEPMEMNVSNERIVFLKKQLEQKEKELAGLQALNDSDKNMIINQENEKILTNHQNSITSTQNLIVTYTNILSDLCRWMPETTALKQLKDFAIKELTTNMPDLSKCSNGATLLNQKNYFDKMIRECNNSINTLNKNIDSESKAIEAANNYINDILIEMEFAPDAISSRSKKEEKESFNFVKI